MYYFLLIIAVFCVVAQFLLTKLYQKSVKQTLITSLVFVVLSQIVTLIIFWAYNKFALIKITPYSLILAIASAIIMIIYQIISIKILSLGNISIYSLFMMLGGMMLPFLEGAIFFPESNKITVFKIIGLILLTICLALQVVFGNSSSKQASSTKQTKKTFYILCIVMFFVNGFVSILTSLQSNPINNYDSMTSSDFTILKSLLILLSSIVILAFMFVKKEKRMENIESLKSPLKIKPIVSGVAVAIVSSVGAFLMLVSNSHVPNVVQYPIITGGSIVFTALAAFIFFKEKQTKISAICLVGAFLSTLLFLF